MFKLCLFDLDQTLLDTADLANIREQGKNRDDDVYTQELYGAFCSKCNRHLYSEQLLAELKQQFPEIKWGIFTRSPRSYAQKLLNWSYPNTQWDVVVAFEDVSNTKPCAEGVWLSMGKLGCNDVSQVVLVGDTCTDVRTAYNAGCWAVLDLSHCERREKQHWKALNNIPDAIFDNVESIKDFLIQPFDFLPEFERQISGKQGGRRFGRGNHKCVNHFFPNEMQQGEKPQAFPIHYLGRYFTDKLNCRVNWHAPTKSILDHKDATHFSEVWVQTLRIFIADMCHQQFPFGGTLYVTAVPSRPGRHPRLEHFISQLQTDFQREPLPYITICFYPQLFRYRQGVRSHHSDHLNQEERFINVRDHLEILQPDVIRQKNILVIDDVMTTGASLIYSQLHLQHAGASSVTCLALCQTIGGS